MDTSFSDYIAEAIKWLLGVLGATALWVVKGWDRRITKLADRLLEVEKHSIGREELHSHLDRIETKLDRLFERRVGE